MRFIDTSVILAHLLAETRRPPADFFETPAIGSKLLQIETAVRLRRLGREDLIPDADLILSGFDLLDIDDDIIARARQVQKARSLDAIHLATAAQLVALGIPVEVCSYDLGLMRAAADMGLPTWTPG